MKLYEKIHAITHKVAYVEKKGFNSNQQYKYAKEDDVLSEIKKLLEEYKLLILPTVKSSMVTHFSHNNRDGFMTSIDVVYSIIDVETGEKVEVQVVGQGADTTDKGVYKAMTGASKYFLMKTFMIPTGNDPEEEEREEKKPEPKVVTEYTKNAICSRCQKGLSVNEKIFSMENYKKPLCFLCQQLEVSDRKL